jgi:translation initiation factor IF-2
MDPRRGICATLIITNGTIQYGDKINVDTCEGKIKMLEDFQGNNIQKASFSSPVLVMGFDCIPTPGTKFICGEITEEQKESLKDKETTYCKTKLVGDNPEKIINVAIKADFIGSCEALVFALDNLAKELNVSFSIIQNNVGQVSENDLKALNDKVETYFIGFRVKIDTALNTYIPQKPIKIFSGDTIYQILDQIKEAVLNQDSNTGPVRKAIFKVSAIFNNIKGDQLVGGDILEGEIYLKDKFKLLRAIEEISTEVGQGQIKNIQCLKQNVPHLGFPNECGLLVSSETEIQKNDLLEFYK